MNNIVLNQTEWGRKTIYVPSIISQDFNDIFRMEINEILGYCLQSNKHIMTSKYDNKN